MRIEIKGNGPADGRKRIVVVSDDKVADKSVVITIANHANEEVISARIDKDDLKRAVKGL